MGNPASGKLKLKVLYDQRGRKVTMPLSCACQYIDDAKWYFYVPSDFSFLETKRSRRCSSCKCLIKPKSECIIFERFRYSRDEIEDKIYGEGEGINIPPLFMCPGCGEQYLNLHAYGYCVDPLENMYALLKEHRELHGI